MTHPRILLTGAAGRVGRLVRPLLQERFSLRLCDVAPLDAVSPDDEILCGDLADPNVATAAVAGVDAVVHLAGLVAPAVSFDDTLAPNYRAVLCLLEACRGRSSPPRMIFASSHHVFGQHEPGEITADTPAAPDGFYGLSKVFGEAACTMYARKFGIRTLILRIGNADPAVVDGRRERMWISGRDLVQLITIGIEHPDIRCDVVYGTSRCPAPFFANDAAHRLGYRPADDASEHRAADFKPLIEMRAEDGAGWLGGPFAAAKLPAPFTRT